MSTNASQTQADPVQVRREALDQNVLLVAPSLGYWHGAYQLPRSKTSVTVDGESVDSDSVTTPRAKLITDKYPVDAEGMPWHRKFRAVESRLSRLKEQFSLKFPIPGVRIIPRQRSREFFDSLFGQTLGGLRRRWQQLEAEGRHMDAGPLGARIADIVLKRPLANDLTPIYDPAREEQSLAYELSVLADEFVLTLPDILRQIAEHNPVFQQVQHKIPVAAEQMRSKFFVTAVPVELAGGSGKMVTAASLQEHESLVREACQRHVDAAIEEMISGPRQQLAEALGGLETLIANEGRITERSFRPVREAIAKIRLFDFAANPDMLQRIAELERRLDTTIPKTLTPTAAASTGFTAAIQSFRNEINDATQSAEDFARFGTYTRDLSL